MRKLLILSALLIMLISFSIWLVHPMFVSPVESRLDACTRCDGLLVFVPSSANRVVIVPRGGTTLFELGRRLAPGKEITALLPAPGLLAIGLDEAPVVGWQDESGRLGAAAAPSGLRRILLRIASSRYRERMQWRGEVLVFGEPGSGLTPSRLESLRMLARAEGHLFAVHDSPSGRSVARISAETMEFRTWLDDSSTHAADAAEHPDRMVVSLAVAELKTILSPMEKLLPLKMEQWERRGGQVVIYGVDTDGLLPGIRGIALIDGESDPKGAIDRSVPSVKGATIDSVRLIDGVEVHRRDTLGVVVEAADTGAGLAIAFDGTSMERWLTEGRIAESEPSVWSFQGDPESIATAIDGLAKSPSRYLLGSGARKKLRTLRALVGPFRTAKRVESRLLGRVDGAVIESRVDW